MIISSSSTIIVTSSVQDGIYAALRKAYMRPIPSLNAALQRQITID